MIKELEVLIDLRDELVEPKLNDDLRFLLAAAMRVKSMKTPVLGGKEYSYAAETLDFLSNGRTVVYEEHVEYVISRVFANVPNLCSEWTCYLTASKVNPKVVHMYRRAKKNAVSEKKSFMDKLGGMLNSCAHTPLDSNGMWAKQYTVDGKSYMAVYGEDDILSLKPEEAVDLCRSLFRISGSDEDTVDSQPTYSRDEERMKVTNIELGMIVQHKDSRRIGVVQDIFGENTATIVYGDNTRQMVSIKDIRSCHKTFIHNCTYLNRITNVVYKVKYDVVADALVMESIGEIRELVGLDPVHNKTYELVNSSFDIEKYEPILIVSDDPAGLPYWARS